MISMNQIKHLNRPIWCDAFLDAEGKLIFPIKVGTNTLKAWVLEWTGIPLWLLNECQGYTGSLNEALALLLGSPSGGVTGTALQAGFERWTNWTEVERKDWLLSVFVAMEVEERRLLFSLLQGRRNAKILMNYGLGKPSTAMDFNEMITLTVNAMLLYVRPTGRTNAQFELTFGLYHEGAYISCLRANLGQDVDGGWIQGLDDELDILTWINGNLGERIGPIRGVTPGEIFELQCESVQRSSRHKSGFKSESVRILKWIRGAKNSNDSLSGANQSIVTALDWVRDSLPKPQDSGQIG